MIRLSRRFRNFKFVDEYVRIILQQADKNIVTHLQNNGKKLEKKNVSAGTRHQFSE